MDTREWKPVNDDVRWARFFDFYHRYPVTSNRVHTVHHVDPNSWIHASLENARNTRNRVKTRERERERSVLVTAVGRAVFFARAPVSVPSPPEMQRENRPIEISYPLFVFARNRRTVSIYTIERVEICVADDFSVTNISPSVSGR